MAAKVKALQQWCKNQCEGYRDLNITNMTSSWKSGLAFCAIINRYRPDLIDYNSLLKENVFENNKLAFDTAASLGIAALLDPEDMVTMTVPDKLCIITYVSQYYNYFSKCKPASSQNHAATKRPANSTSVVTSPDTAKRPALAQSNRQQSEKPVQSNGEPKFSTLQDRCAVCSQKVYLMERHLENNQLYHRQCIRDQQKSESARYRRSVDELALRESQTMEQTSDEVQGEILTQVQEVDDLAVTTPARVNENQESSTAKLAKTLYTVPSYQSANSQMAIDTKPACETQPISKPDGAKLTDDRTSYKIHVVESSESDKVVMRQKENRHDLQTRHTYASYTVPRYSDYSCETTANAFDLNQSEASTNKPRAAEGDFIRSSVLLSLAAVRAKSTSDSSSSGRVVCDPVVTGKSDVVPVTLPEVSSENMGNLKSEVVYVSKAKQSISVVANGMVESEAASLSETTNYLSTVDTDLAPAIMPVATERTVVSLAVVSTLPSMSSVGSEIKSSCSPTITVYTDPVSSDTEVRASTEKAAPIEAANQLPTPKLPTSSVLPSSVDKSMITSPVNIPQHVGNNSQQTTDSTTYVAMADDLSSALSAAVTSVESTEVAHHVKRPVLAPTRPAPGPSTVLGNHGKEEISVSSFSNTAVVSVSTPKLDNKSRRPAPVTPVVCISSTVESSKKSEVVDKPMASTLSRPAPDIPRDNPTVSTLSKSSDVQMSRVSDAAFSKNVTVSSTAIPIKVDQISTSAVHLSIISSIDTRSELGEHPSVIPSAPEFKEIESISITGEDATKSPKPVPVARRFISAKLPEQQMPVEVVNEMVVESPSSAPNNLSVGHAGAQIVISPNQKQPPIPKPRRPDVSAPDKSSQSGNPTLNITTVAGVIFPNLTSSNSMISPNLTGLKSQESGGISTPKRSSSLADRQASSVPTSKRPVPYNSAPLRPPPPSPVSKPNESSQLKRLDTSLSATTTTATESNDATLARTLCVKPTAKTRTPAPTTAGALSSATNREKEVSDSLSLQTSPTPPVRSKKLAKPSVHDSSSPPPRPQPTATMSGEKTRQKITPDVTFTFEKDAFRPGPARPAPLRPAPPPPAGGAVIKRQIMTEARLPVDYITQRLQQLDKRLNRLEVKGRALEERIRSQCDEMMDDDETNLMSSWFKTVNKKNELVREESELMYRLKQQELEDQHSQVEYELRRLLAKPEHLKTAEDKIREAALLQQLVETVSQRNEIIDSMEEDRIRYLEEDKEISQMMMTKGLDQGSGKKKQR